MKHLIKGEELKAGEHYNRTDHPRWKYVLVDDVTIAVEALNRVPKFNMYYGPLIATIGRGLVVIHKGYAWDGASGGCPDKSNMLASLIHDVIFQASCSRKFPHDVLTRRLANRIFRDFSLSKMRDVYYALLTVGSAPYWGRDDSKVEIHILPKYDL